MKSFYVKKSFLLVVGVNEEVNMARLDILKHFEMLKRKFNPGVDERSRLQLSYLGEELSA